MKKSKKQKKIKIKRRSVAKKAKRKAKRPVRAAKTKTRAKTLKPLGRVTHFYNGIGVAIVKFSVPVAVGTKLHFKGATTDFTDTVKSMEYNHKVISRAPKGKQVGLKVKKRVREADAVYRAEE